MLDVEFLLGPPTRLERTLVYRYRSGVLRRPMKRALTAIAENDGNEVFGCLPGELCLRSGGVGLFSGISQGSGRAVLVRVQLTNRTSRERRTTYRDRSVEISLVVADFRDGSCVTSVAGSNGCAQLYRR
jgi:hypothetical protein